MTADTLRTGRLLLSRPVAGDVEAILAIHADPLACAHNPGDALASRTEAEELFGRWDAHWRRHGFGYWVLRRQETPDPIGFCGLKRMELHRRPVLNLLYRLAPAAWGAGLGGEAATAVVTWARAELPGQPVIARVRPDNHASHRVALRAGLRRVPHLDELGLDGPDQIYELPT
ncbi:GNAT family N-acetyltransferase [Crossiella cryophila]|uniref:RimJ/RimL family protein N-acetyltransferase n=1 Tax=Crossiella cryophila TaxID=43355 RepID=A0A7W7FTX0_9PSEU|nr:GNAT family N-acetyltransferase [Crossiella cryophila]MBB4677662.1 RimJ/RimL family protein N-acetyltransferase [Crossiella cryophila]